MPLMAKLPAGMEEHDPSTDQVRLEEQSEKLDLQPKVKEKERDESDSGYEDFDAFEEEPEDSDMEGSILHRPRPKKRAQQPPAVPQRSDKRASKILENVLLELKSLDGTVSTKEAEQQSIVSDPHELYLSSEEDASLSDDYEDVESLVEFESSPTEDGDSKPSSRASSRRSQEDTARMVSFTLVTKPQIIQIVIPPPATAAKRHSMNLEQLTSSTSSYIPSASSYIPKATRRPIPLKLYPSTRRLSVSSISSNPLSMHHSNQSLSSLPPRKSSKLSNLSNIMTNAKNSFLSSDPFATPTPDSAHEDGEQETPVTPKTPTSMAASAWKKSLGRTMSKARKPSMPKLSLAYTQGVVSHRDSSLRLAHQLALEETKELNEERARIQRAVTMPMQNSASDSAAGTPTTPQDGPLRYQDIMKNVIKAPPPPPSPVKERKMSISSKMSLGLSRRKSVKGKGERYVG